jgi:uncharacterized protein (DUF433 family)
METTVAYRYITTNKEILSGEPIIKGTRTPVRSIVETWRRGVAPEEIPEGLPHLTLAQVFEALSYYSDNQEEINGYIEKNRVPKELMHPLVRNL